MIALSEVNPFGDHCLPLYQKGAKHPLTVLLTLAEDQTPGELEKVLVVIEFGVLKITKYI